MGVTESRGMSVEGRKELRMNSAMRHIILILHICLNHGTNSEREGQIADDKQGEGIMTAIMRALT